ncbi:hypothetical protein Hypma_010828 [Hypsizygus marmoreus]|uniref:Fungal-type protein kinase domain-containing protein n=1 Tax=Hypsizygus marmoreus TaxID=39966 RepID=A0A369JIF1_HYPMA|nr:hypothetical protein Hypma_010828 [Hypsizygus marmoreus]
MKKVIRKCCFIQLLRSVGLKNLYGLPFFSPQAFGRSRSFAVGISMVQCATAPRVILHDFNRADTPASNKMDSMIHSIASDVMSNDHCDIASMLSVLLSQCLTAHIETNTKQILSRCLQILIPICNDADTGCLLKVYCDTAEKDQRCSAFVECFNAMFDKLDEAQNVDRGAGTFKSLGLRSASDQRPKFHINRFRSSRDPDIALSPTVATEQSYAPDWFDFLSVVQFTDVKTTLDDPPQTYDAHLNHSIPAAADIRTLPVPVSVPLMTSEVPPLIQNGTYATQMLCRGIHVTHTITLVIAGDIAWDLPYFLALLIAFQRFNLPSWGMAEELMVGVPGHPMFEIHFPGDIAVFVGQSKDYWLSDNCGLTGRCTRVLQAFGAVDLKDMRSKSFVRGAPLSRMDLALKSYWAEDIQADEAAVIKFVDGLDNEYVAGHIPDLIASFDLPYSTATIRKELRLPVNSHKGLRQPRVLRLLLFKCLCPITKRPALGSQSNLTEPDVFMCQWVECYRCHRALWLAGVEHGDVSLANLMYNPDTHQGVLNDFDFSVFRQSSQGVHVAPHGTAAFMPLDLLCDEYSCGTIQRLYRHDLESFIWVLVWMTFSTNEAFSAVFAKWDTYDYTDCKKEKLVFLYDFAPLGRKIPEGVDQRQGEMAGALLDWILATRKAGWRLSDESLFREFEDIVAKRWAWEPAFRPMVAP